MTRTRSKATLIAAICMLSPCVIAKAQNSANAPPPASSKLSGSEIQGDPTGAIRALGSADEATRQTTQTVTVPQLGGQSEARPRGTPPGTAR